MGQSCSRLPSFLQTHGPTSRRWEQRQGSGSPGVAQAGHPACRAAIRSCSRPRTTWPPASVRWGFAEDAKNGAGYVAASLTWPAPDRVLNGRSPKALKRWDTRCAGACKGEQRTWTQLKAQLADPPESRLCLFLPPTPPPNAFTKHKPPHFSARPSRRASTPARGPGCG